MREEYFSVIYGRQNNVPMEKMEPFFQGKFKLCSVGKADLKEEVAPYLPEWNWPGTPDEFLKLWFETENKIDKKVLAEIQKLREKGIPCYIATQQEKYRKKYLWEYMGLNKYFDGIFCTCDVGYTKFEPEFLTHLINSLKSEPEDIVFFDDKPSGVEAMKKFGIDAHVYKDIETLKREIEKLNETGNNGIFWIHLILIILSYLSFLYLDWKLILLGAIFLQIYYFYRGGCDLTFKQFGNDKDKTFVGHYLAKLLPGLNQKKAKLFVRYFVPVIILLLAFLFQAVFDYKPLLDL